ATCPFIDLREPTRAVELATKATALVPQTGSCWIARGVAEYRTGHFQEAIDSLQKAGDLLNGSDATEWLFTAMAHWQLGDKEEARKWYDKGVAWTKKNAPNDDELQRFQQEAAKTLEITEPKASDEKRNHPTD